MQVGGVPKYAPWCNIIAITRRKPDYWSQGSESVQHMGKTLQITTLQTTWLLSSQKCTPSTLGFHSRMWRDPRSDVVSTRS